MNWFGKAKIRWDDAIVRRRLLRPTFARQLVATLRSRLEIIEDQL